MLPRQEVTPQAPVARPSPVGSLCLEPFAQLLTVGASPLTVSLPSRLQLWLGGWSLRPPAALGMGLHEAAGGAQG